MEGSKKVRISALQLENVKRVKAFALEPVGKGLTIIGGKNANGKTSVLDGIAWLLGGAKFSPSSPQRDGAMNPPKLSCTLTNGLTVERKGKNAALTVTDTEGKRHGQSLLDSFVSQFALDLPKFMDANDKEKAQILLSILGIGEELTKLTEREKALTAERRAFHSTKEAKVKHAEELPEFPDAPDEPVSVSSLIKQHQAILAKNGENQRKREQAEELAHEADRLSELIANLKSKLADAQEKFQQVAKDLEVSNKTVDELEDESSAEIEDNIENMEAINADVAANQAKAKAEAEAEEAVEQYETYGKHIDEVRKARLALLEGADLPLDGLTVEDNTLLYNGKAWDCMSGAEQLRVATAIVQRLNPNCGFVLIDKLEQFDSDTLQDFCAWLIAQDLQAIAARVSTGEECTIIIEDGLPAGQSYIETVHPVDAADEQNQWGEDW